MSEWRRVRAGRFPGGCGGYGPVRPALRSATAGPGSLRVLLESRRAGLGFRGGAGAQAPQHPPAGPVPGVLMAEHLCAPLGPSPAPPVGVSHRPAWGVPGGLPSGRAPARLELGCVSGSMTLSALKRWCGTVPCVLVTWWEA